MEVLLPRQRVQAALDASHALSYLHGLNPPVYHRDVKSANIALDLKGRAKLIDFGLSSIRLENRAVTQLIIV